MSRIVSSVVILLAAALLAGCGQKGPLYLPGDPSKIAVNDPGDAAAPDEEDREDDDE